MELLAGTSGYAYDAWKGPFYPEKLASKEMLAFYASQLPAVEINNTFYRLPKRSVLETWAGRVPEGFRFVIKASRRITHFKRLKDAGDETGYLLENTQVLGPKLGALLFQLPPNLKLDLPRLDAFLELLPAGTPAAFEFRHESWHDAPVLERLRARDCAWVVNDDPDAPAEELMTTAPWVYLRLRRPDYGPAQLATWLERLRAAAPERAFAFFKHEDAGAGPRMALAFLALAAGEAGRRAPRKAAAKGRRRASGSA